MSQHVPYHHGNLRAALLAAAEQTLRERGVEQISLRDLARQVGVSHGAPSRHFRDRQALLEALAAEGYRRLGEQVATAVEDAGDDYAAQLRAVATRYVRFAVDYAALLDLMFTTAMTRPDAATKAPERPYEITSELIRHGQQIGMLEPGDPERLLLLIIATVQGIASLVTSRRIPAERADDLIADAIALFMRGPAATTPATGEAAAGSLPSSRMH